MVHTAHKRGEAETAYPGGRRGDRAPCRAGTASQRLMADAEGLNAPEGHTRPSGKARRGRSAGVLRPWPAGREASKHWGGPRRSCAWKPRSKVYSSGGPAGETRRRTKAGTAAARWQAGQAGGGVRSQGKPAGCGWGVVASVVLRGGESPPQGEGLDGSTQPGKATQPGHVGPEQHEPTSLRAIAHRVCPGAAARATEEPEAGKRHVRDCTGGVGQPAFLPWRPSRQSLYMPLYVRL